MDADQTPWNGPIPGPLSRWQSISRLPAITGLLLLGLLLGGCDRLADAPVVDLNAGGEVGDRIRPRSTGEARGWRFGFDIRISPSEDARQYLPFLAYLENATGEKFRLIFKPAKRQVATMLGRNEIDFAALGAMSYVRAHRYYGARILAHGLNPQGKAEYRSCLVTLPDSPIRTAADLRHRLLAFGSMSSTQGHLIPRILLREADLGMAELGGHQYTGSHRACAEAVLSQRFDACGMQDTLARRLAAEGRLRIIRCSRPYPSSGIAAAPGVPDAIMKKVRRALLDFDPAGKHRQSLYHWERTEMPLGFVAASDVDYDDIAQWMVRFKMLDPARKQIGAP